MVEETSCRVTWKALLCAAAVLSCASTSHALSGCAVRAEFTLQEFSLCEDVLVMSESVLLGVVRQQSSRADSLHSRLCLRCETALGAANPAAVYCTELGYEYRIVTGEDGSQHGMCMFNDREECSAWDFLQGKCGQRYSYCARLGCRTAVKGDGKNAYSSEYAVCVTDGGEELGAATKLFELDQRCAGGTSETPDFRKGDAEGPRDNAPQEAGRSPSSFDWRDYADGDWTTPVKDQGICNSCSAFSAIAVVEAMHNIRSNDPALDLNLSEEYLVSDCHTFQNNGCCGGETYTALEYIRDEGVVDEPCMGYVSGDACTCVDDCSSCEHPAPICSETACEDRCQDWQSRLQYVDEWSWPGAWVDPEVIKQLICANGPVAAKIYMGPIGEFIQLEDGTWVYVCSVTNPTTTHAVVVVGYNDDGQYWIVKNSYGSDFGDDGFFNVAYDNCSLNKEVISCDLSDSDGDGIGDVYDNCPNDFNPDQQDADQDGLGDVCDPFPVGIDDGHAVQVSAELFPSHPNPAAPATSIRYRLHRPSTITLRVFSISGRLVRTLLESVPKAAGVHGIVWDGTDEGGRSVSSGAYFYRLESPDAVLQRKLVVVR